MLLKTLNLNESIHFLLVCRWILCCVVLMHVFSHLDDISLWSASRVCRRWASIIHQSVSNEQWSKFTLRRWPLFRPNYSVGSGGWASVFSQLVDSSPCLYCLHRSNVEEEGANWEPSNHWRNNRLCNEWRMVNLHIEYRYPLPLFPLNQLKSINKFLFYFYIIFSFALIHRKVSCHSVACVNR